MRGSVPSMAHDAPGSRHRGTVHSRIIGTRALQRQQRVLVHEGGRSHCKDTRQSAHSCHQAAHDVQRQLGRASGELRSHAPSLGRLLHIGPADASTHASVSQGREGRTW